MPEIVVAVVVKSEFGNRRRYLVRDDLGNAVLELTGQVTLSYRQQTALRALGVDVRETQAQV